MPIPPRGARGLIGLVLLWSASAAAARCDSTPSCLGAIAAAQKTIETVRARFVQTKHLGLLDEPLTSRGGFLFKRPDRVAWQLEEPQPITIVIDDKGIHIPGLSAREKQAMAMIPAGALSSQFGAIFTGSVAALEAEFDVSASSDEKFIRVHLVPRREDVRRVFRTLDLDFPQPPRFIARLSLADAVGDRVEIAFEDVQLNVAIPDSAFVVADEPVR